MNIEDRIELAEIAAEAQHSEDCAYMEKVAIAAGIPATQIELVKNIGDRPAIRFRVRGIKFDLEYRTARGSFELSTSEGFACEWLSGLPVLNARNLQTAIARLIVAILF